MGGRQDESTRDVSASARVANVSALHWDLTRGIDFEKFGLTEFEFEFESVAPLTFVPSCSSIECRRGPFKSQFHE